MTRLTLVRRISARPSIVFEALIKPEGIAQWWGLDAEPKRLVMSWQWISGGEPEEDGEVSRIEIDLKRIDAGTEITLTHACLRTVASRASHERGWAGALDKLMRAHARRSG